MGELLGWVHQMIFAFFEAEYFQHLTKAVKPSVKFCLCKTSNIIKPNIKYQNHDAGIGILGAPRMFIKSDFLEA